MNPFSWAKLIQDWKEGKYHNTESKSGAIVTELKNGKPVYQEVLEKSSKWGNPDNMMYVVGATRPEYFADIRKYTPNHFYLVPGVGAQGGDLDTVVKYGANAECGLLVNSSRAIIYASSGQDFAVAAKKEALKMQAQMALHVQRFEW